jgi:hypothetical protein
MIQFKDTIVHTPRRSEEVCVTLIRSGDSSDRVTCMVRTEEMKSTHVKSATIRFDYFGIDQQFTFERGQTEISIKIKLKITAYSKFLGKEQDKLFKAVIYQSDPEGIISS